MASCLFLERPGRWRAVSLGVLLLVVALPNFSLLARGAQGGGGLPGSFVPALLTGVVIALCSGAVSAAIGWPAGVATALYEFRLRRLLLALALLPSLVPPFLLSLGWSYLSPRADGILPCVLVFSSALAPLVLLASHAAVRALPPSLLDAARLAGGDAAVLWSALRYAAPPAILAAAFAGVLTLSDPGPGQVFGVRTAASELLVSFAAHHDLALAGRQSLVLAAVALAASVPLAWFAAPRLRAAFSARAQAEPPPRRATAWGWVGAAPTAALAIGLVAPLVGLVVPLARTQWASLAGQPHPELVALWAAGEVMRTTADTILYALGAAAVSVVVALLWTAAVGRQRALLRASMAALLPLLALPSAGAALGLAGLAARAPAWADDLARGRAAVCVALGLRLSPIAVLLVLRAFAAVPPSRTLAAALHGVPLWRFLARVLLPALLLALLVAALLVGLLAGADVSTVLLLHPPGHPSLPLAIFTVMANAPEHLVAVLCLLYVGLAAVALAALWSLTSRAQRA